MFFVITCHDKPDSEALRKQTRPSHLEYLAGHEGALKVVGPLLTADGTGSCGSLIIMEAGSEADVKRFADHDPYAVAGLFESVSIRPWKPVVGAWLPKGV